MKITISSIILTCLISTILIIMYGIILKQRRFRKVGIDFLSVFLHAIIFILCFPVELSLNIGVSTKSLFLIKKITSFENLRNSEIMNFETQFINGCFILWILGVLFFSIRLVLMLIDMKKTYTTIINQGELHYASDYIKKPELECKIVVSRLVSSPMVLGFYKTVFIPDIGLSEEELKYIISHEMMHIKNKDMILKMFINLLAIFYWWFLPIYLLKKYVGLFIELRVDASFFREDQDMKDSDYVLALLSVSKKIIKVNQIECSGTGVSFISNTPDIWYRVHHFVEGNLNKKTNRLVLIAIFSIPVFFNIIFLSGNEQINAGGNDDISSYLKEIDNFDEAFQGFNDSDLLLKIPNGGVFGLQGDANGSSTITETDMFGNIINEYDIANNPKSITVKHAREIWQSFH